MTDFGIIGVGIQGISNALFLQKKGFKIRDVIQELEIRNKK